MDVTDLLKLEEHDYREIYENEIKQHVIEIENLCETYKIPMVFAIQTTPIDIIESHTLYPNKTDERLYTCKSVLEKGDLGFTNIYTKSAEDFRDLNNEFNQVLTEILSELISHDSQFGKTEQPAGTCRIDFGLLRARIKEILKKQHLPTG